MTSEQTPPRANFREQECADRAAPPAPPEPDAIERAARAGWEWEEQQMGGTRSWDDVDGPERDALLEVCRIMLAAAAPPAISRDEQKFCPRCGAPDPEGFTREELDG